MINLRIKPNESYFPLDEVVHRIQRYAWEQMMNQLPLGLEETTQSGIVKS